MGINVDVQSRQHDGAATLKSAHEYSLIMNLINDDIENVEENVNFHLPKVMNKILSKAFDADVAEQADQIMHNKKMKSPMDLTCQTSLNKVETRKSLEFYTEQEYGDRVVAKCLKSGRLRSHKKETFIKSWDVTDLHRSPTLFLSGEVMKKMVVSKKKTLEFDDCVRKFMESSKFVVSENLCGDIEKLDEATEQLKNLIYRDLRLADCVQSDVVERLVQILENIEYRGMQYQAVRILSTVSYDKCREVINEQAVPVLVKLMTIPFNQLADAAVITLTHLACASSNCVKVIVDNFALGSAWEIVKIFKEYEGNHVIHNISMLLVAVCRANIFSADQEKSAIIILQNLLQKEMYNSSTLHIKRACYALSYLSYERHVEVTKEVCKNLVELLFHDEMSVVGSALGVAGNIVRWGSLIQIQYMTKDCQLLKCLGKSVLCSEIKKFRKEACQIISNVAARSEIQIKDEAGLIERLRKLLENDEPDVKMEAAWAIYNTIYGF
ncbi:importin subunit alpha-1a-like [Apium graveolens]|uniref:importin subunit alpha-1a-like n=1 Tax=Apium graveolens TaxID=4045 RepID=UPI003D7B74D2